MIRDMTTVTVIALAAIAGLVSCGPVKKVAKTNDVAMVRVVNSKDGKISFINPRTGDRIPSCAEKAEGSQKPCRTRIKITADGKPILLDRETNKRIEDERILHTIDERLTIILWKGSHCETSSVGGQQWEDCWPW